MSNALFVIALFCAIGAVFADTFIHGCMEGSNNKLNEVRGDTNRDNANRLFNSQNGAGGGYYTNPVDDPTQQAAAYRKKYYVGSELSLEWVNQHGSGDNAFIRTNFVWQYMCNELKNGLPTPWKDGMTNNIGTLRDGYTTNTITYDGNAEIDDAGATGRHEPWSYYHACANRERNMGLFTGDENINGDTAIYTRANGNGNQYGTECSEDRLYYPYWHPTPWVDLAYLTSTPDAEDAGGCEFIQANSFNVRSYHLCSDMMYNNKKTCEENDGKWEAWGPWNKHYDHIEAPVCEESQWSKVNHLGFGREGHMNQYNWTIPALPEGKKSMVCVLRERYNMTQGEIKWNLDWKSNDDKSPVQERDNNGGANDRVENYAGADYPQIALQIALNADQYFRIFEDRTHAFEIVERPKGIDERAMIYNLGVKGSRGNLQTLYPMVENDFCPQHLVVKKGDYIHFQLHGANFGRGFNRNNGAGAGRTGGNRANRHNMVQLKNGKHNFPMPLEEQTMFDDKATAVRAAFIDQDPADCNSAQTAEQANDNCSKLNASDSGYLDLGVLKMNNTGTFYYMSSRNNHNTNRGEKGIIVVEEPISLAAKFLLAIAGILAIGSAGVAFMAHQSKNNPSGTAARMWDRLSSAGSSLGGGY